VAAADLDGRCTDLRRAGLSYRQIGRQLSISPANAHKRVMRTLDRTRREPGDGLRELELERLDHLQVEATRVLAGRHVVIQAGKVVVDTDTGLPFTDHGPTLAAIRALVQVQESRRQLLGLDAPARIDARVLTIDQIDARIGELQAQLGAEDPDYYASQQRQRDRETRLKQFTARWSRPGEVRRDPAGFVGNALELGLQLLDLDDQEREAAGLEVETLLLGRVHP
jgi:hypothetical protein